MPLSNPAGYTRGGLPYNRSGSGPRPLIVFQGLLFENKPMSERMSKFFNEYAFLESDYTIYVVGRKPGLPQGYSLADMAKDYADMIGEEFGQPVDIIGISTGGSIAQVFAATYPQWVRRLILHSSAHTLSAGGKAVQLKIADFARQRRWRDASAALFNFLLPRTGLKAALGKVLVGVGSYVTPTLFGMRADDPSDLMITVEAEDHFHFKDRLSGITVPTLVIAGDHDPFYTPDFFRETAAGIPNGKLVLYPGKGHMVSGAQFKQDVLAFLREG